MGVSNTKLTFTSDWSSGIPENIFRWENSLEGSTGLTESCFTHSMTRYSIRIQSKISQRQRHTRPSVGESYMPGLPDMIPVQSQAQPTSPSSAVWQDTWVLPAREAHPRPGIPSVYWGSVTRHVWLPGICPWFPAPPQAEPILHGPKLPP